MPIHDWTRVDAGLFHDFHQDWTIELRRALNAGRLPPGYVALISRVLDPENGSYAHRANRIAIQGQRGEVVAAIEVVSPGNKSSPHALRAFVRKACDMIRQGIHLLVIDLFPPSSRNPQGIHKAMWDELAGVEPFVLPADKPLAMVAYQAVPRVTAFVEPLAVGDDLSEMPVFLAENRYIVAPLEETYRASWAAFPAEFKRLLEGPPGG